MMVKVIQKWPIVITYHDKNVKKINAHHKLLESACDLDTSCHPLCRLRTMGCTFHRHIEVRDGGFKTSIFNHSIVKTCKPVAIFNVVDLSATAFKIKITRKEVFRLNIIQENHKLNAVLSQDSKVRRKKNIDRKVCLMYSSSLNVQLARDRNS